MVTGGLVYIHNEWVLASRVQEYSTGGEGERLPDLNTARYSHACGHYIKDDKVVTRCILQYFQYLLSQILTVIFR